MSNARVRLLLFFIAIPSLVAILLFLPHLHYVAFSVICILASGLAALELAGIFYHRGIPLSKPISFLLGALGPASVYGELAGFWKPSFSPALFLSILGILYASEIIKKSESDYAESLPRMSGYTFIILYPGIFSSYAIRLTHFSEGGLLVLVFLLATFLNDSFAWTFGMLFGRNNRNLLLVSPNKSLVGFIAGFLSSPLVFWVSYRIFPHLFPFSLSSLLLFGSIIGFTTLVGDLIESVIKRSAAVKDSGNLIPGRGGLLDSIDSPLFNAPIFYYLYIWFAGKY
ncbi:MAG: phosphatidate cytidylyltransferase [Spirochaetales bacterium]